MFNMPVLSKQVLAGFALSGFLALPSLAATQRTSFAAKEARVPVAVSDGTARLVGPADRTQKFELAVAVPVRNQAELTQLLVDLYNPNSPKFHHYLSVPQFADSFGPSKADYAKVVSYLKAQGFTVTVQHANRMVVSFRGDAEIVERAFNVKMNEYQHPHEARTFYAPDREPTITGLDVKLQLVAGLDNYVLPVSRHKKLAESIANTRAELVKGNSTAAPGYPSTTCYGTPYSVNVGTGACTTYTPSDLRTAYATTSLTGSGQQIGIFGFGGACASDTALQAFDMNVSPTPTVTYKLGAAAACTSDGEQVLDIVMAAGMAPSATLNFFSNTSNDLTICNAMASDTSSSIYTSSWGWESKNYTAEDVDFQEMSAQGQTYLNATGDDGGYSGYYSRSAGAMWYFPSGDPYITQVGGTQLVTTTNGGSWSNELGWPGSSGGVAPATAYFSTKTTGTNYGVSYAQPTWQSGVATTSNGVSSTKRTDPDIAAQADYEYIGCEASACQDTYGGTSYATPLWAGILSGMNAISVAAGNGTIGFINPQLYAAGKSASFSNIFHDPTACGGVDAAEGPGPQCNSTDYSSTAFPEQGYNLVAGYDGVTGWGSPNGSNLIATITVPALTLSAASGASSSSYTATLSYPDISGAVKFYAKSSSGAITQIGSCTLTSSTCSATIAGTTVGIGTFSVYGVYSEVETYNGTTRTVLKTSNTKTLTISADISITSVSHNFGSIQSGTSTSGTANYGVQVTNNSANAVSGSVVINGSGFTQNNNCGTSLSSGAHCEIIFTFSPTAAQTYSATWYITGQPVADSFAPSNGGTLTGTGVATGAVTLTTNKHNFGTQTVGTTSAVFGAVLTNSTSSAIALAVAAPTGNTTSFITYINNCGTTLAAGANCNLQYEFKPIATGGVSEFIGITANGGSTTITAAGSATVGLTLVGSGQ